jgi:hypothetical protein
VFPILLCVPVLTTCGLFRLCVSPWEAVKSVYETNKKMWKAESKICTRNLCIGTTAATILLFPLWILIFWCKIVYDILTENSKSAAAGSETEQETIISIAGTVSDKVTR